TQRRRTIPGTAHESHACARTRADRDVGGLLALGAGAFPLSGVVVLACAWTPDARAQGIHTDWRRVGRFAAAAWCIRRVAALVPAAGSLRPGPSHLPRRQRVRGNPRAVALRGLHRRPDCNTAHGRSAERVLPERGSRVAVVHTCGCRSETHRPRGFLRREASRHAVARGPGLDRRKAGACGMSDPEVANPGAPADHITPYDRLALDEASLIAVLASRASNEGLVEYFGEALHAELAAL